MTSALPPESLHCISDVQMEHAFSPSFIFGYPLSFLQLHDTPGPFFFSPCEPFLPLLTITGLQLGFYQFSSRSSPLFLLWETSDFSFQNSLLSLASDIGQRFSHAAVPASTILLYFSHLQAPAGLCFTYPPLPLPTPISLIVSSWAPDTG